MCKFHYCLLSVPWYFIRASWRLKVLQGRKQKDTKFLTALAREFSSIKYLLHQQSRARKIILCGIHVASSCVSTWLLDYNGSMFPVCARGCSWKPGIWSHVVIHMDVDHSSQICRDKPGKVLSEPFQSHAEHDVYLKAYMWINLFPGLSWSYLMWATVWNCSAG